MKALTESDLTAIWDELLEQRKELVMRRGFEVDVDVGWNLCIKRAMDLAQNALAKKEGKCLARKS
jgi:hypothetical protein